MIWGYPYFWKHPNCSYHLVEFIIWNILEPSFLFYATLFSGNLKNVFCPKAKPKRSFAGDSKWPFHIFHPRSLEVTNNPWERVTWTHHPKKVTLIESPDPSSRWWQEKYHLYTTYILPIGRWKISPIPPVVREPETAIIYGPRFRPVSAGPAPEGPFWSDLFRLGKKKGRPEPKEIDQQKPNKIQKMI